MPELPDIIVYIDALEERLLGRELKRIYINHPFFLRSVEPRPEDLNGKRITSIQRIGKRIALGFEDDVWCIVHLMIAGRLHWLESGKKPSRTRTLAAFVFPAGTLIITEAGSKKRASLNLVRSGESLKEFHRGGRDVRVLSPDEFRKIVTRENHTLKRILTDQRFFDGIGNAYSDEILHRARLSPVRHSGKLDGDQMKRLYIASRTVLTEWIEILRKEAGDRFPERVTAFRPEMAVHGKFGKPCPVCGTPVQRIRYVANETNYCPACQTDGKILADRSLSRILKNDWPRNIDEL